MVFNAVLDASVLYPLPLRDTLLRVAEAGLYEPCWSERILEEATPPRWPAMLRSSSRSTFETSRPQPASHSESSRFTPAPSCSIYTASVLTPSTKPSSGKSRFSPDHP
jgi:hypothetical protein